MSIYFAGCSNTYGDDLTDYEREHQSWPVQVGKALNSDIVNDGISGGTNDGIVDNIMLNAHKYDHIIIGWSSINRFTLEDSTNWINVRFNLSLIQHHYNDVDYFKIYGKYHYLYWNSLTFIFKRWLIQIISIQSYLKEHNKKFHMISSGLCNFNTFNVSRSEFPESLGKAINIKNFPDDQIYAKYDEIQILINQIDFNTFLSPEEFNISSLKKIYKTGSTDHLLTDGHNMIAKTVLEFINKG